MSDPSDEKQALPTLSSGVEKTILQEGTGNCPSVGSFCKGFYSLTSLIYLVYYEARILPTRVAFDDVYSPKSKKQEFHFEVGTGNSQMH